jgi:hypothetical protein
MSDERRSSMALIAGSVGMIITMVFHPHGKVTPAEADRMIRMLIGMHSLALASLPILFLGVWGMARWMNRADRLAMAGLVFFSMASVAVMNAAVLDGLVAPNLIREILSAAADARAGWQLAMKLSFEMNQAFARLYAVASAAAIVLWSVSALKSRMLGWGVAIYGFVLGVVSVVGIGSGKLTPDVHGFGLVVFAQAIWFLLVAARMWNVGSGGTAQREGSIA